MKRLIFTTLILMLNINCFCQKKEKKKDKNLTKVSFNDRVNNIKYSHDFIMNYNCTKMKPIKIMQGFIISDSTESKSITKKTKK